MLVALDGECFAEPWTQQMWHDELERPFCELWGAFAETGGLAGYCCVWFLAGEAHLLRIATASEFRRRGIGQLLMDKIRQRALQTSCEQVQLEVASRNVAAIGLYQRFGFEVVGRRPGYYRNPNDDAVLMTYELRG